LTNWRINRLPNTRFLMTEYSACNPELRRRIKPNKDDTAPVYSD
jgi:hypothetical protein